MLLILCLLASAPDTLWANVTSGGVYSTISLGDLNGDSVDDVACGVNFWDEEPTLWCLSGSDGSVIWTSDQYNGIYQDEGLLAVSDVNSDGHKDILIATPGGYAPPGRCLILISGIDGSLIWEWSAYNNIPSGAGWGYSCAEMEDQTGDIVPEFLGGFGSTGSANSSAAVCLNGATGDTLWTRITADAVEDILTVPDVTGDGVLEVYLGIGGSSYADNTLLLVNGADGTLIWGRNGGENVMCVSTLDREDTVPLLVSSSFDGDVQCYNLGGDSLWSRDLGGFLLDVEGGPDINGDGTAEVAVAGDNSGTICLDGATGVTLWTYPTGANTWSVAWSDSVYHEGMWIPCISGGSVNGKKITLVNALNGSLIWEQSFTERVYNVTSMYMNTVSPSAIIIAGLQDQQSQPYHAWAFLSSTETSCDDIPDNGYFGNLVERNPAIGVIDLNPPEGNWRIEIYDLTGRLVWQDDISDVRSVNISDWSAGCYLIRASSSTSSTTRRVTVLK